MGIARGRIIYGENLLDLLFSFVNLLLFRVGLDKPCCANCRQQAEQAVGVQQNVYTENERNDEQKLDKNNSRNSKTSLNLKII
jgi:hypothetical protein